MSGTPAFSSAPFPSMYPMCPSHLPGLCYLDYPTSSIMGIPVGLLRSFGDWWHVCPENLLFLGDPDTLFPLVQVFPSHGNFFHFLRPIARQTKQFAFLATLLLPVWLIYGRHTVKWIEPIERVVDAIVLLWLFDIIFKSVSRSSQRLTKA
jgi:hypothetical protein